MEGRGYASQTINGFSCFRNSAGALVRFTFLCAIFYGMCGRSCTCVVYHAGLVLQTNALRLSVASNAKSMILGGLI